MEPIFWGAVTLVFYTYAGYPALLLLVGRWRGRPVAASAIAPRLSLIVSVRNAEHLIGKKIDNCLALDYPADRLEILVASDGSDDGTNEIVQRVGDPRVSLVAIERRLGKEAAQRAAISRATGEVVVFTDVGVQIAPTALRAMIANFADATVGCVSGVDRVVNEAGEAEGEGAFVKYETLLKQLESAVGSTVGNSGWFFAVRRSLCDVWPEDMASDFTMLLRTVRRGFRGVVEPRAVGYATAVRSTAREFQRKVRTIVRGMVVVAAHKDMLNPVRHPLFAIQLLSHKICRWMLPLFLLVAFAANGALAAASPFYRVVFLAQVIFYAWGLLAQRSISRFFVSSNGAAVVAWAKFLAGEKFVVWDPTPRVHRAPSA